MTTPTGTVTTYTYDANGNLIEESDGTNVTRYRYTVEGKLIEVEKPDGSLIEYGYDGDGRRISQTVNGATTRFYCDRNQIAKEMDTNGVTEAEYLYGLGGMPIYMMRAGQTYYYLFNGHGDTVALTDSTGAVVATYQYDPFGKATSTGAIKNPFQYTGQYGVYHDEATGFDIMQVRYYNSTIGSFISPDPFPGLLESPISQNAYLYANSDPINHVDPNGHFSWGSIWNGVKSFAKSVGNAVKNVWNKGVNWVKSKWNSLKSWGKNTWKTIKNDTKKLVDDGKAYAEALAKRLAEEQRKRWENFKKDVAKKKEEFNQKTQDAIDEAFQVYKAGKEFVQEKAKEGLASLAQSANTFMESKAGQVVKDLVKIGGGLAQMAIGANLALLSPINMIFSGKLLQEGFKNATGGMETTTGKYVGASIQAIAGAIEFGVGFGLAAGASWTGVGLVAGAALMGYGANNMVDGGTSIYNMATGQGNEGINMIRDSVFTPVFGDKWGSILYAVTDIGVGFMGPGLMTQAKNLPKLGGLLSGAKGLMTNVGQATKGLMTNIPQMLNGAKAGLTNFVEGVKNFPIIPETVINVGDRFVSTKGKTAGDLFNFIVGKGDDAGDVVKGTSKTGESLTSLYRAVGPDEFYDVMKTGKFNVIPNGLQAKQFGLSFEETLKFADKYSDIGAIIEVKVPTSVLNKIGDFTQVDKFIFKSGTVTIHADKLGEFNKIIQELIHKY